MPDVVLGDAEQRAMRALIADDQPATTRARRRAVLEELARLIGCDAIGVGTADRTGVVLDEVSLPRDHLDWTGPQACDGPLPLGIQHWSRAPCHASELAQVGLRDSIAVGFRSGTDHVVQVWLDRWRRPFDDRDVALLTLVSPALSRILRDHPAPALPPDLTVAERRVLQLVATGLTNAAIAERLTVAPCTVRKHLEHAYRKLGAANRVAAVRLFEGRPG